MNVALVDMDQTLCDYEGTVKSKLVELFGPECAKQIESEWATDKYKPAVDLIKRVPNFWRTLPKIELGFKIVEILKDAGFDLHILTKGPYRTTSAWTEKVEWCREHMPNTPVSITEDKGLFYGKLLVDDWPPYCEAWLKWRPRGLIVMPAYYYNEGFDKQYEGRVIRTDGSNLDKVKALVEKVAKRGAGENWNDGSATG